MSHFAAVLIGFFIIAAGDAFAQTGPSPAEMTAYRGLHAAAAAGDVAKIQALAKGADINARDGNGRTPLMVAAFLRRHDAARALIAAGADLNLLDHDRYDVLTISGVIDDPLMVKIAIDAGADARLITSRYDGTALIASAHLGHVEVVRHLIAGKAPLDHVNNLGWTALIEAIVLGDGGPNHQAIVKDLIAAGANINIADRSGVTPLGLARRSGYGEMVRMLEAAGARE
ncbi:MAG: ankyrin repeat domain-containing protein [Proteobacteria bacterium]|nr:ankyrin repeat domain-containing protein [Pseudomonadota bacterium]